MIKNLTFKIRNIFKTKKQWKRDEEFYDFHKREHDKLVEEIAKKVEEREARRILTKKL